MDVDQDELKRVSGNLNETLENRVDGKDNPVDRSLSPPAQDIDEVRVQLRAIRVKLRRNWKKHIVR